MKMDFRSLCSKFDVDAIRAKFPPLPDVMTHIKLPKSLSKLKSRKIFRSSREDVASEGPDSTFKRSSNVDVSMTPNLRPPPSSDFVNHTPSKISTISSLVDKSRIGRSCGGGDNGKGRVKGHDAAAKRRHLEAQDDENFYRSAGGIEDYCPSPLQERNSRRISKTESPNKAASMSASDRATSEQNVKMSFKDKIQKANKDVSDFRFRHFFVKKTVVRQDDIQVDNYVQHLNEDRRREERTEEKRDRAIADNYEFEFKVSRRKSEESFGVSTPSDSPLHTQQVGNKKPLSEQSGDESGMEQSPPTRKPGIAATRFSRVRHPPLQMSLDEDDGIDQEESDEEEDEELEVVEELDVRANESALYRRQRQQNAASERETIQPQLHKSTSIKKRLTDFTNQGSKANNSPKKRKAPLSPQQSEETKEFNTPPSGPNADKQAERPFVVFKQNLKRFQKSMKLPSTSSAAQSAAESDMDESNAETATKQKPSKTQQIADRLKRFRSVENVDKHTADEDEENKTTGSPLHKLTNKLQEWSKSFKKRPSESQATDDEATSPQKCDKPGGTLIRRLKHMRSRKQHSSTEDPDDDEEGGVTYKESFKSRAKLHLEKGVAAATHMPQMTLEKIKESKKYFRKKEAKEPKTKDSNKSRKAGSDESDMDLDDEAEAKPKQKSEVHAKTKETSKPPVTRHYYSSDDEEEEEDDDDDYLHQPSTKITLEPHHQNLLVPLARAAWSTKPIHPDSMDTGDDEDDDDMLPRVLIHQDNSDVFESTLIIAVTRPMPRPRSPSPYITEIPPDSPKGSTTSSPKLSTPETKAHNWKPNREIISGFLEVSPPTQRKLSSTSSRGHSRKHSMDSSSEDSWIKDIPRGPSTAVGLNRVCENEEPWKIQRAGAEETLYKSKSIDIFELHPRHSGELKIFEDFDDELKNTPIVKIEKQKENSVEDSIQQTINESFEQDDSSEEYDNADDDNSSRITKILKSPEKAKSEEPPIKLKLNTHLYGNSRESLMGNLDEHENDDKADSGTEEDDDKADSGAEEDDEDSGNDEEESDDSDRPPSLAPSPPPSVSPPPPPIPHRQPSLRLTKLPESLVLSAAAAVATVSTQQELPPPLPPLPQTKPPLPPNRPVVAPPKIPERTPSMSKVAKPLVKTASLRLAYSEQVNPKDVGKVNKLISRFEPNGSSCRPRIIPHKQYISQDSEDYSDQEEEEEEEAENVSEAENEEIAKLNQINANVVVHSRTASRDITPTNKPRLQKSFSIDPEELPQPAIPARANNNNRKLESKQVSTIATRKSPKAAPAPLPIITTSLPSPTKLQHLTISSNQSDTNSNISQPSSEYGSPMAYPSSLVGSTEVTPIANRKETDFLNTRRSRRSMTRDDERYYSFDSDEENSYYSISSTNSSRYVVEL